MSRGSLRCSCLSLACLGVMLCSLLYPALAADSVRLDENGEPAPAASSFSPRLARPSAADPAAPALDLQPRLATAKPTIGLDALQAISSSGNLASGDSFDAFRAEITSHALSIKLLTRCLPEDLAGLDAIILKYPVDSSYNLLTDSGIAAIQDYVRAGGGLLILNDVSAPEMTPTLNKLLKPYGLTYSLSPLGTEGNGYTITGFVAHPVTRGLTRFGVDYQRCLTSILPPAIDLTINSGPDDALACVDGVDGAGNVVVLSDASLFTDTHASSDRNIAFGDNLLLLRNIITYISGYDEKGQPVPVALSRFAAD